MSGKGTGGGTSFEGMSHEQMLAWLDQANAGTVQGAADRLIAAAKEIRKIAEELKVRPQYVEWKGEGADAFRTWSGDLANSALRLGDFSEGAAKWLGEASGAIATAQASIPRDTKSAQANLGAARAAHNDPDAAAVSSKSTSELAALAADKEKVRQEAAAQMRKLGQTYSLSATQLDGLERPKFPPPPQALVPPESRGLHDGSGIARPGGSTTGQVSRSVAAGSRTVTRDSSSHSDVAAAPQLGQSHQGTEVPGFPTRAETASPSRMDIDSVDTLPHASHTPVGGTSGLPSAGRAEGVATTQPGNVPPLLGTSTGVPVGSAGPGRMTGTVGPAGQGRAAAGPAGQGRAAAGAAGPARSAVTGRTPSLPSQGTPMANPGGMQNPSARGVVGGRPTRPPAGRSAGAIPRGTVVGAEDTTARGSVGPKVGSGPAGRAAGRQGQIPSRGPVSPTGGVMGGSPQQTGRVAACTPAPGNADGRANSGAAVRDGISGGTPNAGRPGKDRSTGAPRTAQSASSSRTSGKGGRSDRQVENDKPRQEERRRTTRPVTD